METTLKKTADPTASSLLTAEAVPAQLQLVFSSFLGLQTSAAAIEAQPTFDLSLVPTLPEDQALLLQHLQDYRDQLSDQILSVMQAAITAGEQVADFSAKLLPMALSLDAGDPRQPAYSELLTEFDALLLELQNLLTSAEPGSFYGAVYAVQQEVDLFYNEKTEDDQTRFQTTLTEAASSHKIADLIAKLAALQQQINATDNAIAQGATSALLEVAEFAFAIGSVLTGDIASLEVAVNVAIAVSDEAQKASGDEQQWKDLYDQLDQQIDAYVQATEALIDDEQQYAALQTIAGQAAVFAVSLQTIDTALQATCAALTELANGFGQLRATDQPPTATYFADQISGATQFWASMQQAGQRFLSAAQNLQG